MRSLGDKKEGYCGLERSSERCCSRLGEGADVPPEITYRLDRRTADTRA